MGYPKNCVISSKVAEEAQEWANAPADQWQVINIGPNVWNVSLMKAQGIPAIAGQRTVTVKLGLGGGSVGASAYTEATPEVLAKPTDDPPKFALSFTNEDTIETESRLAAEFGSTDKDVIVQALGKRRVAGFAANTEYLRADQWDFQTTNATTVAKTSASFSLRRYILLNENRQEAAVAVDTEQEAAVAIAKSVMEVMSNTMGGLVAPALVSDIAAR